MGSGVGGGPGELAVVSTEFGILVFCHQLTASDLASTQNNDGIVLSVLNRLEATELGAIGNAESGIAAFASELRMSSSVAAQNRTGMVLGGNLVVLEGSTASNNGPAGPELFDGAGFAILANRLEASGNTASGNEVGWIFDEQDPFATVEARTRGVPGALAARFASRGGGPLPPQRLTLRHTTTEGNLAASIEVRLRAAGSLSIGCSDFFDNSPPGLDAQTDHTVDARFNFWGHLSGPDHPGNPGGTGDPIQDGDNGGFGTVLFGGFLIHSATDEDCPVVAVVEVPALGPLGLVLLTLVLACAGVRRLRA